MDKSEQCTGVLETLVEIDAYLYKISVSEDDVFRMVQARQKLLALRDMVKSLLTAKPCE